MNLGFGNCRFAPKPLSPLQQIFKRQKTYSANPPGPPQMSAKYSNSLGPKMLSFLEFLGWLSWKSSSASMFAILTKSELTKKVSFPNMLQKLLIWFRTLKNFSLFTFRISYWNKGNVLMSTYWTNTSTKKDQPYFDVHQLLQNVSSAESSIHVCIRFHWTHMPA